MHTDLIANILNSPEIGIVRFHAVFARVRTFVAVIFLRSFFYRWILTLFCNSFSPDLCLEEDLNHAMANCFEALLGEFVSGVFLIVCNVLYEDLSTRKGPFIFMGWEGGWWVLGECHWQII